MRRLPQLAPLLLLCGVFAGCAVGPNFTKPKPEVPPQWSATASQPPEHAASRVSAEAPQGDAWWQSFNDPMLTSLVQRSVAANLDVRKAVVRIEEARAERSAVASSFWPSLSADARFTRQRFSETTPNGALFGAASAFPKQPNGVAITNPFNQNELGLSLSWEIDLFGRVRRSVEAASAELVASQEFGHDVLLSLQSDVARAYIELRGAQLRHAIAQRSLDTDHELMDLTRERRDAGLASDLDVASATSQANATAAQLPLIDAQISGDINQLSRLMSREPDALRSELIAEEPVPPVPPQVPAGLPSDLARRRPDIRRSEASLHAETARVGVAVADLFPRLTLTAAGGYQSEQLSQLVKAASHFGSFAPALELPIFDAGRRQANIRLQKAKAQEAGIDYARTVLGALHEVENAILAYGADQERRVALEAAVSANRDALALARDRYRAGISSFIDVLDLQRALQQNEMALGITTTAVSTDLVQLYRALGGGWQSAQP